MISTYPLQHNLDPQEMMMMKVLIAAAAALLFASNISMAQGPGSGPGAGPGGPGKGPDFGFGPSNTSGWSMMSSQERTEHRDKLLNMKTYAECKAYLDEHRKTMEARAKEKGIGMPAGPRADMCERMKQRGRIS